MTQEYWSTPSEGRQRQPGTYVSEVNTGLSIGASGAAYRRWDELHCCPNKKSVANATLLRSCLESPTSTREPACGAPFSSYWWIPFGRWCSNPLHFAGSRRRFCRPLQALPRNHRPQVWHRASRWWSWSSLDSSRGLLLLAEPRVSPQP